MRQLFALVALLLVAGPVTAIEPPKQDKPPASKEVPPTAPIEPAESQPEPAEAPAAKPEEEEEETLPPLPADVAPGPSPTRFNPTEKVRADFPVSFPIDI